MKATHDYGIPPSKRIRPGRRVARHQRTEEGWRLIVDPSHELLPDDRTWDYEPITVPDAQIRQYCEWERKHQATGCAASLMADIILGSYAGMTFELQRGGRLTGERVTIAADGRGIP